MTPAEARIHAMRTASTVTKLGHVHALKLGGPGALDLLDAATTSRLFARENQMLQTLMLNEDGTVFADAFVCLDEDSWVVLAEGPSRAELVAHLERVRAARAPAADVTVTDLLADAELWGLDGPFAWEVTSALLGPEILGAPYLSFMHLQGLTVFRAGKTGEFGYCVRVPKAQAPGLWAKLMELGAALDLLEADLATLDQCAIENWHFTIRALDHDRSLALLPIELQLQWRVDAAKQFWGADAMRARAPARRMVCFSAPAAIPARAPVAFEGTPIGSVLTSGFSTTRADWVGWAVLDAQYAWAGVTRYQAGGTPVTICSPPVIDNRSLFVDPRKHTYRSRHEHEFPPLVQR